MGKHTYYTESAFRSAWYEPSIGQRRTIFGQNAERESFVSAAHFVGGSLLHSGFRLFRNGGLPLLERRVGPLVQEIILDPGPGAIQGRYIPMSVRVHISHEGMREVRQRYWTPASRAPVVIASGQLGLLDLPPGFVIWNVASSEDTLEPLARWIDGLALPWFELFEDPMELARRVCEQRVPLLKNVDALELVLAEFGPYQARRFLRDLVEFGAEVSPVAKPLMRVNADHDERARLDAIATCFRLR